MRRVLYLNNFMTLDIADIRNNRNVFSQPGNNKVTGVLDAMVAAGCNVTMLSSCLVNKKTGKWYKRIDSKFHDVPVVYCSILDLPLFNSISSIISMYRTISKMVKNEKIDNILFYNYKPEVAWTAYFVKKRYGIPITVEYEDGFTSISYLGKLKKLIFGFTENFVSKQVDSAIVVNSLIASKYDVPTVVVRGVVNTEFYRECCEYQKQPNDIFTILYSGGLNEARGIYVLIDALKYISFNLKLVITGKGEFKPVVDPRIDFRGFVSIEEAHTLMRQADLLAITQLKNNVFGNESFPSKLFEYIATGNMIVASSVSDIKEFAGNSIDYYDNDDPRELAAAIEKCYQRWLQGENTENRVTDLCIKNLPDGIGNKIVEAFDVECKGLKGGRI